MSIVLNIFTSINPLNILMKSLISLNLFDQNSLSKDLFHNPLLPSSLFQAGDSRIMNLLKR